jgi:integrase/recombinase XerD
MLVVYRRHNPAKCKFTSRSEYRCKCPIWVTGTDKDGKFLREALNIRDWNRANELVRKWDVEGSKPTRVERVTIDDWQKKFIQEAEAANLSGETLRKYRHLFRQIQDFARDKGIRNVASLDLTTLDDFRATWNDGPLSSSKKLERLRSIFKFALVRKWISENPATNLKSPQIDEKPTLPFPEHEMSQILKATVLPEVDVRVRAFVLTMRHSGLRISDTTALACASLTADDHLQLYQAKTGEYVSVLLPAFVAGALRKVTHRNPAYFFWSGTSKLSSAVSVWRKRLAYVFKKAKTKHGHSHRFRDTFAVAMLQNGVTLEDVSTLLGHTSIRITQKHYSPWVKTRQDALDKAVAEAIAHAKNEESL